MTADDALTVELRERHGKTLYDPFMGMRIQESLFCTEAGEPVQVRRTWLARLFSWPWRPWQSTYTMIPQVPMKGGYRLANGVLVMHPEMVRRLRDATRNGQC